MQAGTIGLIGAVDRFDPGRGLDFLSFAVPTITNEIRRHFRDRTWSTRVPRRLKDVQATISGAVDPLSQELGRAPRPTEIAARLGLPPRSPARCSGALRPLRRTAKPSCGRGVGLRPVVLAPPRWASRPSVRPSVLRGYGSAGVRGRRPGMSRPCDGFWF